MAVVRKNLRRLTATVAFLWAVSPSTSYGFTANAVWFEFHPRFYRVIFQYTVPALKERREGNIDFTKKRDAEKFYFSLLRGGDFTLGKPVVKFTNPPGKADPW